jgi:putative peptidoglycan lipid II flippase
MSDQAVTFSSATASPARASSIKVKTFVQHAKLIGFLTLISRFFGLGREIVAGHYLGTALVGSSFTVAFVIPNLFRKLFGEGALSAAFIPLYAQAIKTEQDSLAPSPGIEEEGENNAERRTRNAVESPTPSFIVHRSSFIVPPSAANDFAAAAVNLLCLILVGLTIIGEGIVATLLMFGHDFRPDRLLTIKLTAIMLPYVLLICGGAFLSGILQVHKRFGPPAAAPIILNACHILVLLIGAKIIGLNQHTAVDLVVGKQTTLAYWLAFVVLVAGVMQVGVLLPALRQVGFRFKFVPNFWTPAIKKMLMLSLPVAMGVGVLQVSVLLDKGISWTLMQGVDNAGHVVYTHFNFFGHMVRYPLEDGAPRRLDLAQFLYQFPLGIFAIALATAIFPGLSADALSANRDRFCSVLRHGIEASLWEGLPASLGLILVAEPAARLLFQHGQIPAHHAELIARSTVYYAGAIWAFSLLQIINRAYYAIHDTVTPLVMSIVNIVINLVVEVPLLWVAGITESGMAIGTLASFIVQALLMLWMLDRKIGGLNLRSIFTPVMKMIAATLLMGVICFTIKHSSLYPLGNTRIIWAAQLAILLVSGGVVYLGACAAMGVSALRDLFPSKGSRTGPNVPGAM